MGNVRGLVLLTFCILAIVAAGCGPGGSEMTTDELNALTNPGKTIPKEAQEGMANMGELIRKQQEANRAAGVDDRGIPIAKSTTPAAKPGTPAGGKD